METLLLPPAPNWFQHNGVSVQEDGQIYATAAFRNIVIYKIKEDPIPSPVVTKLIFHPPGRVIGVSLYPDAHNKEYGRTIAVIGDQGSISLINVDSGLYIAQHQVRKACFTSICWALINDEECVAVVGENGLMTIWQPKYLAGNSTIIVDKKCLSVVEALPHIQNEALIACEKSILHVRLKDGSILRQFKGHNYDIYCIRWYCGSKNPLNIDLQRGSVNGNTDDEGTTNENIISLNPTGPYFATSDFGKYIFIWDFSCGRYISKTEVASNGSFNKRNLKDKSSRFHISLAWVGDKLYSSTVQGEVQVWNLKEDRTNHAIIYHLHNRVIYNMVHLGNLLITSGQDRQIIGYDISSKKCSFQLSTVGVCASTMAFSPHDASRLAIGFQDGSIRLITFQGKSMIKSQNIGQNVKGKVLSIAWHPAQEGRLLFGTADGQVGMVDVYSNRTNSFAYYHQRGAYKVEWGPAPSPGSSGLSESWYAYSFGDKEIAIRSASNLMQEPPKLHDILILKRDDEDCIPTDFSFSPDHKYLAVGYNEGSIKIYDMSTRHVRVFISAVRKSIQHLLWKPPCSSNVSYTIAVGSGETKVYIFDLESSLLGEASENTTIVTQGSKELSAHSSRIVWLSWSPHKNGILASASYDHTVQVWDANSGDPLCNYGGHAHRVFRVEFCPIDADVLFSFSEENCLHTWRQSEITSRTPKESKAANKECLTNCRPAEKKNKLHNTAESSEELKLENGNADTDKCLLEDTQQSHAKKQIAKKSYFPVFHTLTRKRSHLHMAILTLKNEILSTKEKPASLDAELEDLQLNDDKGASSARVIDRNTIIEDTLNRYSSYVPSDQTLPEPYEISGFLDYFGNTCQIDESISKEITSHEANENFSAADQMQCWRGSLEDHIKWCVKHKRLNAFLVSVTPQVSFSLWESTCSAYAEQLIEQGDYVTAATYLSSIQKAEEAVFILLKEKHFREALCLAKCRTGFNSALISEVANAWAKHAVYEGSFELAATLYLSIGKMETAARTMSRRTEPTSLMIAAELYIAADCIELADVTSFLALKEASLKNEFDRVPVILQNHTRHDWFEAVHVCQIHLQNTIEVLNLTVNSKHIIHNVVSGKGICGEQTEDTPLMLLLPEQWKKNEIHPADFSYILEKIKENFSNQQMPVSLKQLWFSVSIALSEILLTTPEDEEQWEKSVTFIVKSLFFWNKPIYTYLLTHVLLPNGTDDLSTLGDSLPTDESQPLNTLCFMYYFSELLLILEKMESVSLHMLWSAEERVIEDTDAISNESPENDHVTKGNVEKTALVWKTEEHFIEDFEVLIENVVEYYQVSDSFIKNSLPKQSMEKAVAILCENNCLGESSIRALYAKINEVRTASS